MEPWLALALGSITMCQVHYFRLLANRFRLKASLIDTKSNCPKDSIVMAVITYRFVTLF